MKSFLLLLVSIFLSASISAQKSVDIKINHMLDGVQFENELPAKNNLGNDFMMDRLQYYISNFSITHDGGQEIFLGDLYVLVSLLESNDATIINLGEHDIDKLESVSFHFGVDEKMNHADPALHPEDHPLAPKFPSMHWGWASGYRFIAIEGLSGPNIDQEMQFHGIGDEFFKKLSFTVEEESSDSYTVELDAEYANLIKGVDVSEGLIQHGNLGPIQTISLNFVKDVFTPSSVISSVEAYQDVNLTIYPNPSYGQAIKIETGDLKGFVKIHDSFGRLINQVNTDNTINLNINNPGIYSVSLWNNENELLITKKLVIQ